MFTVEQIGQAHSKVKSGADFPAYIQDIKKLGVTHYETLVINGSSDYYGANGYKVSSGARYDVLRVADVSDGDQFKTHLAAHQRGKTDFLTFCNDCARSGVAKWEINTGTMTCTYYDQAGKQVLVEEIPQ